jgi:hypothetical protein
MRDCTPDCLRAKAGSRQVETARARLSSPNVEPGEESLASQRETPCRILPPATVVIFDPARVEILEKRHESEAVL